MSNECMSMPFPVLVEDDPVEDLMDRICGNCRYPFTCEEEELEEECDKCRIEREIRILLGQVQREDDFAAWDSQFEDSGE